MPPCTCRCGCTYPMTGKASIEAATCFSCRVELHAGRRKGWTPQTPDEPTVTVTVTA